MNQHTHEQTCEIMINEHAHVDKAYWPLYTHIGMMMKRLSVDAPYVIDIVLETLLSLGYSW